MYLSANKKGPNDASVSTHNSISALNDNSSVNANESHSASATQNESGWKTDQLPIMKSITDGFHPIYVHPIYGLEPFLVWKLKSTCQAMGVILVSLDSVIPFLRCFLCLQCCLEIACYFFLKIQMEAPFYPTLD